ncbi:MAG: 3-hydroxyacyl-CoA dehydrogenase NAD-binding domain-containing protein, partial [Bacillota bacterium]
MRNHGRPQPGWTPRRIAVIGAGTMGAGIAQVALQAGLSVVLHDVSAEVLRRARERIFGGLAEAAARGKLREEPGVAIRRLTLAEDLQAAAGAEAVVEAVPEDLGLKQRVFAELDRLCPPEAILATNTSSLPVTAIARATAHPGRVVGLHFFNPVPAMRLVEVIPGAATEPGVVERAVALARALGKEPVVARDTPGFIVNRIARPFYLEALRLVAEGVATPEQVDRAMVAAGFRMGPFALIDLVGLDVNLAVSESVYQQYYGEPRFRPQLIQARMVQAGRLGRKVGAGFYAYPGAYSREAASPARDATSAGRDAGTAAGPGPAHGPAGPPPAAHPPAGAAGPAGPWSAPGEPLALVLIADPGTGDEAALADAARRAGVPAVTLPPWPPGKEPDLPPGIGAILDLSRQEPGIRRERLLALESRLPPEVLVLAAHPGGPVTPLAAAARYPDRVLALGGLPPYGAGGALEVGMPLQAGAGDRAGWGPVPQPQEHPAFREGSPLARALDLFRRL